MKYGESLHRYPNLLNRNIAADRPNQKWVTDISYIRKTKLTPLEKRRQSVA